MSVFQIISLLFALFMLYVVTIHWKRLKLSSLEGSFWYSIWVGFAVLALFPNLLLGIAQALRFARVFDLLIVVAFMVLTVIVVLNHFTHKKNNLLLEEFVRKQAIQDQLKRNRSKP